MDALRSGRPHKHEVLFRRRPYGSAESLAVSTPEPVLFAGHTTLRRYGFRRLAIKLLRVFAWFLEKSHRKPLAGKIARLNSI